MNPDNPYQQPPTGPAQAMPPSPALPPAGQPLQPPQMPVQQSYPQAGVSMSEQKKQKPWGLIIALVVFVLAFLGSSGFAFWAYAEMQDYKNNSDQKVAAAVDAAIEETKKVEEQKYAEQSKSPYLKYSGPDTFGRVRFDYPKTWSATVDESSGSTPVNGFFHRGVVPGPRSGAAFALRLEVLEQPYDRVLGSYESSAKRGTVRVSPFKAERVPAVLGARIDGEVEREKQGSAVVLPLRDKTIRISTLSGQSFGKDFDDVVLKTLEFTP